MTIVPILMAGGIGSRLWPRSRSSYPKQFHALISEHSMLQEAVQRASHADFAPPVIVCNQDHRFLVAEHCRDINVQPGAIILEAAGRGTAFTIAVGALQAMQMDPEALIFVLSCDQKIDDATALHNAVSEAAAVAKDGSLMVFGVEPKTPYTGYGYIQVGENVSGAVSRVAQFTEKPDQATAEGYLADGNYLWNAGIFLFKATTILEELQNHAPEVYQAAKTALAGAEEDLDFLRLPSADCESISIDYAVLEKSDNVCVTKLETGWSDLGSWQSVWSEFDKDGQGNVVQGDAVSIDTKDTLIMAHDKYTVATLGVQDLAIITDDDAVLVASLDQAENVSQVIQALKDKDSSKQTEHRQVYRPWGNYKVLDWGEGYLIKSLVINPGGSVSLQYHNHRAEHWVVVKGEIKVVRDDEEMALKVNESVYIPIKAHHRIVNESDEPAQLIEVQTGDKLVEEDIVRLEDKYKRA